MAKSLIVNSSIVNCQFIEQSEILILLLVHLLLRARGFVLLSAEVQNAVNYHSQHLLSCRCTIQAGIIPHRFDIDKYVARDIALFEVAIVKSDNIGEVVVPEELDIHRTMTLRRAENIVYLGNLVAALLLCHLTQPPAHKSLLWQAVVARICVEVDIHAAKVVKNGKRKAENGKLLVFRFSLVV